MGGQQMGTQQMGVGMTPAESLAAYRAGVNAFESVGIAWNEKGSPHRLLLNAKKHLKNVPFYYLIGLTLDHHKSEIVENIQRTNALFWRLKADNREWA